jgi:pilus assembly protein Flp/PilA
LSIIELPLGTVFYSELTETEHGAANRETAVSGPVAVVNPTIWEFTMSNFISAVKTFAADENGVTAIEYGLIAALIGVVAAAGATVLGKTLEGAFKSISSTISAAVPTTPAAAGA